MEPPATAFDTTAFTLIFGSVTAGIASLLTILLTKGPKAYSLFRAEGRQDAKLADDKVIKGFEMVVSDLRARLERAEARDAKREVEHLECVRTQAELRAENAALKRDQERVDKENAAMREDILRMDKEIDELRDALRKG